MHLHPRVSDEEMLMRSMVHAWLKVQPRQTSLSPRPSPLYYVMVFYFNWSYL